MSAGVGAAIERAWYTGNPLLWLLLPLSALFWLISSLRRKGYQLGILKAYRPRARVIVVGNISVGGNGKTPVVIALAEHYKKQGRQVGVVSRGYGGKCNTFPYRVRHDDPADKTGDEPLLIARRTGLPVVIDPVRARGVKALEALGCTLIICDDGLQHYALARDVEIVVMDNRQCGNGKLMPMGPLREGRWRLNTVDVIVHNSGSEEPVLLDDVTTPQVAMTLSGGKLVNVNAPAESRTLTSLGATPCIAIAGIGNPARFFSQLSGQGVVLSDTMAFADHHQFVDDDIPDGLVLMTEKDAVKMHGIAHDNCWYLPVEADLPPLFYQQIDAALSMARDDKEPS
ncbi:tetraacyldisaccharide 4'-kinase [Alteromonas sp. CYL-A6]|uniref:tetraacyldisaccharide 4'-kinase n=1 Tax=Alteromonas nitratireducens TaxID=3390813 RepID=UPI0034B852F8